MRGRIELRRFPLIAGWCLIGLYSVGVSVAAWPAGQTASPTVSFTLDFPEANPSHYVISVGRDGHGTYVSNGQMNQESAAADPSSESDSRTAGSTPPSPAPANEPLDFTISDRVRDQIFDLAERAHYFSGKVDSGRKNIANTGTKTLVYQDEKHDGQATYNYSTSVAIEQLTAIFQNLSETLEFGRRLSFFHKYQKLALDDDLKRMEELQQGNNLGDVQAIAPVLKQIADDHSVMNVARARALRLMAGK
jgi:hypothetical protein